MAHKFRRICAVSLGIAFSAIILSMSVAFAQTRQLVTTPNVDYPGSDYRVLRNTNLERCKSTCLGERRCQGFTYNSFAKRCFLKSRTGRAVPFDNAVSGRIVIVQKPNLELQKRRQGELAFLSKFSLERAQKFTRKLKDNYSPKGMDIKSLERAGQEALSDRDPASAARFFGRALAIDPENLEIWFQFTAAVTAHNPNQYNARRQAERTALSGAINAYLRVEKKYDRAWALVLLARALEKTKSWKQAFRAYKASLALEENAEIRRAYNRIVDKYGFRVTSHEVDSESAAPRICVKLSDPLPKKLSNLSDFIVVENNRSLAIEHGGSQICVDGVKHGLAYKIQIRAGLPANDGQVLRKTATINVYVRDRSPWVGFAGKAYILPRGQDASIPIISVNTEIIKVTIYRIGDRGLIAAVRSGVFLKPLSQGQANEIANKTGEKIWQGEIEVKKTLNKNVITAIPITKILKQLKPGAYVIVAHAALGKQNGYSNLATQWFAISDLGLTLFKGSDGVHAFVRSLGSAKILAGVKVRLVAVNDEILARGVTDRQGYIHFAPGLVRGEGGNAPRLLIAEGPGGDYAFLDFAKAAFDLTDRGVAGRPAPKPVDIFLTSERGIYRPGETVHLTALVRNALAQAIENLPLTMIITRPDGVESRRVLLKHGGLGGYHYQLKLRANAMRGAWQAGIYTDPKAKALALAKILVEDFVPERLAFDLKTKLTRFDKSNPIPIDVEARYLYGAPAPDLSILASIKVSPLSNGLKTYPGYVFGLEDEKTQPVRGSISVNKVTDAEGKTQFTAQLPAMVKSTKLFEATIITQLNDTNGRAIERSLTRPIRADGKRIGVRALFTGGVVEEGAPARFELIMIDEDAKRVKQSSLKWTLEKIDTDFQWYRQADTWKYEQVTNTRRISSGVIDINADRPAALSVPVAAQWGRYRFQITSDDGTNMATSVIFSIGWYSANSAAETPDFLDISLDKESYRVGDKAIMRIKPRFAGTALISVIDNRLITMKTVEVGAQGTSVSLDITKEWGPGAYVVATLYRPMDVKAKRMPGRALGLKWLKVDVGTRVLKVELDLPEKVRPRKPFGIPIAIKGLKPGTEAYVTVAAIDQGILNLTRFKSPEPDKYYFGQRVLGMEIRDVYGQLINRLQGVPGKIRSGGDIEDPTTGLKAPPPTQKLVAFFSGIIRVDENGKAVISFDIPDFNGTIRVMAMAWTRNGLGHAVKDVVVRDPVVVAASTPRFLTPGDSSRLYLEITNLDGPQGEYTLKVTADKAVGIDAQSATKKLRLELGKRQIVNVPISGDTIGVATINVELTGPDGMSLPKKLTLAVQPSQTPITTRRIVKLSARDGRLVIDKQVFHNLLPGTRYASIGVSPAGRLDVPGLLLALDRYPYGCTEQLTSRALPLVYFDDVAKSIGLAADTSIRKKVAGAISGVLANQSANGGFGLWRPGNGDLWLDAYVTDFLTRAKQKDYKVPALALRLALDNLSNRISYASNFQKGGQAIAYALYVLARNGKAAIGDLRYFGEAKLSAFATPLAKAQIGAALALYGDRVRAGAAFRAAVRDLAQQTKPNHGWRLDYGTSIRDEAAILTLVAETGQKGVDLQALAASIATRRAKASYASTQENAWMLMAAHALIRDASVMNISLNGVRSAEPVFRKFLGKAIAAKPIVIENRGTAPIDAVITTTGVPIDPEPKGGEGFKIKRSYFKPDGTKVDISKVSQNDRFIVVLTVTAGKAQQGRLMVVDALPAGFEIENPNLMQGADLSGYKWLNTMKNIVHVEARTDRFVAALNRSRTAALTFSLAYTVRAVSPGNFKHPAATIEDMYRPNRRARTATSRVKIAGPAR